MTSLMMFTTLQVNLVRQSHFEVITKINAAFLTLKFLFVFGVGRTQINCTTSSVHFNVRTSSVVISRNELYHFMSPNGAKTIRTSKGDKMNPPCATDGTPTFC